MCDYDVNNIGFYLPDGSYEAMFDPEQDFARLIREHICEEPDIDSIEDELINLKEEIDNIESSIDDISTEPFRSSEAPE